MHPGTSLWPVIDGLNDFEQSSICVFAVDTRQRIHCSDGTTPERETALPAAAIKADELDGHAKDDELVTVHRDLFLRFEFGVAKWRIVVAEPHAEVCSSASTLTISLLALIALGALCAFVFATRLIR